MADVTRKRVLNSLDGTPEKRLFLSIISDYDLRTGLCELIDNALDLWIESGKKRNLRVQAFLGSDLQRIEVTDNAGGVREQEARLLVAPGASRPATSNELIGIFGVGGKRAAVALGEHVEIRTRFKKERSLQIDITNDWLNDSTDWGIDIFEIPAIKPGTTTVEIAKLRQSFDDEDIEQIGQHLSETYSQFIEQGCVIELNGASIDPIKFDAWSYPPKFLPRKASFSISPTGEEPLSVRITAGLINDRDPEADNYGVYFYCNNRLIVKELRTRDVGYFITSEAGVPHPDASLCRVIVELNGAAELMPWNSSKSGLNFSHPVLSEIRSRIIEFVGYFSKLSRRLKNDWDGEVYKFSSGQIEEVGPEFVASNKKLVLPKLPRTRRLSHMENLKERNKALIKREPWTLGLIESMGFVDLLGRQKADTKNRVALILLDSNFEIGLKEFIVHRNDLFPPYKYNNVELAKLFKNRTEVIKQVTTHIDLGKEVLGKVNHYYTLRNNLIHERASVLITDEQVEDYRKTIEQVLRKLFKVRFPRAG